MLDASVRAFYAIRNLPTIQKKPATSELVDWIRALTISGISPERIEREIPFAGVLLKKNEDLDTLERSRRNRR